MKLSSLNIFFQLDTFVVHMGIDFLFARSALNENESFEIGQKEKWLIFIFMSVKIHNCSRFNIR